MQLGGVGEWEAEHDLNYLSSVALEFLFCCLKLFENLRGCN